MIKLKIPEKEKYQNEGQWFKDYMGHVNPHKRMIFEYERLKSLYEIVNMDLTSQKDKIQKFCNPLGDILDVETDEFTATPELKTKIQTLVGEIIKRNEEFKLTLTSSFGIKRKDEELFNLISQSVDERLGLELQAYTEQLQGMPQEEAQQMIQQLRSKLEPEDYLNKKWLSELEIFYNTVLKNAYQTLDIKNLQSETIQDAAIADKFFVFNGWKNGKPFIEIRNPLNVDFHKDPNQPLVHKGSWVSYKKATTMENILNTYDLEEEDVIKLTGAGSKSSTTFQRDKSMQPIFEWAAGAGPTQKNIGLAQSDQYYTTRHSLVWETHFEFIAYKRVIFLSYADDYGKEITEVMSDQFDIPDNAVKEKFFNRYDQDTERYSWVDDILQKEFTAETIWIPRLYEIVRLGSDVYPIYREVPYQYVDVENPFDINLSTKGVVLNARNSQSKSMVEQALPAYFTLLYVQNIIDRELSKFQGYIQSVDADQIPDELADLSSDGKTRDKLASWIAIRRKTNIDLYSGSQTSYGGLPPATRSPGSSGYMLGVAGELLNLYNLSDYLKREIGLAMGISPQREANFTQGTNVSDNQQAVIQSYTITEGLFFKHSLVWKDVLSDYLKAFRQYAETRLELYGDLSLSYWLPDSTQELLKVTPKHIEHADVGLYLQGGSINDKYSEFMLQSVHAFAQNSGEGMESVSQVLKDIISGASPEEVHKRIMLLEQKQQQRQQQLQEQQNQTMIQVEQMKQQSAQQLQDFELQKIRVKAELDLEREIQVAAIQATGFAKDQDINNNQVPDVIDLANVALKERQLDLKEKEMSQKKDLEEKKIAVSKLKKSNT